MRRFVVRGVVVCVAVLALAGAFLLGAYVMDGGGQTHQTGIFADEVHARPAGMPAARVGTEWRALTVAGDGAFVARSPGALDDLFRSMMRGDDSGSLQLLERGDVYTLARGTRAWYLTGPTDNFGGVEVRILDGEHEGELAYGLVSSFE